MVAEKLKRVSSTEPCRHCGKPDWCYRLGEVEICQRGAEPLQGWVKTKVTNKDGIHYYAPASTKQVRPKAERVWEYRDRQGSLILKVHRTDDGLGGRRYWQSGNLKVDRGSIPIYLYSKIREAIARNDLPIFLVEGEGCVEKLWELGLPATTNLGGAGKWKESDTADLEGASRVVLCPDRDVPGVTHCENIEAQLKSTCPDLKIDWLYAFPDSFSWGYLPPNQGADIADWIADLKLDKEDILKAIAPKQESSASLRNLEKTFVSSPDLQVELAKALDLSGIKKEVAIAEIRKLSGVSESAMNRLIADMGIAKESQGAKEFIASLDDLEKETLPVDLLPESLIAAIDEKARQIGAKKEVFLTSLLAVSSLFQHPKTRLHAATDMIVSPGIYAAIVGDSGAKKSPAMNILTTPLSLFNEKEKRIYEEAMSGYKRELKRWEQDKSAEKGDEPKKPERVLCSISSATGEAIAAQLSRVPDRGLMFVTDELAALFKEQNQYRKGADSEAMLSAYDGASFTILRASGVERESTSPLLSILGTIQPRIFQEIAGNGDFSGLWGRFIFCLQPYQPSGYTIEDWDKPDTHKGAIAKLYEKLENHCTDRGERVFTFTREAAIAFIEIRNRYEEKGAKEIDPGLQSVWGKCAGRVCKLAMALQTLWYNEVGCIAPAEISVEVIKAAKALTDFYVNQYRALRMQNEDSLEGAIAHVLRAARKKGDWISAREIARSTSTKKPLSSEIIQSHFLELEKQGLGKTEKRARSSVVFLAEKARI